MSCRHRDIALVTRNNILCTILHCMLRTTYYVGDEILTALLRRPCTTQLTICYITLTVRLLYTPFVNKVRH